MKEAFESLDKLLDRAPLFAIVIGLFVIIIGAAGGLPVGNPPLQITDHAWRIGLGIIGGILVIAGLFLLLREPSKDQQHSSRDIPASHGEWERDLQGSIDREDFPPELLEIMASTLADKLRNLPEQPDTLLAVKRHGQWLAQRLATWFRPEPVIIWVEKDGPERTEEYLEIRVQGMKIRPNLYIAYEELYQSSDNMVLVDDFVDGGGTVLSIVHELKEMNKHVKAVATIAVSKANLVQVQDSLKANAVELVYLLTWPDIYHSE